MDVSTAEFGEKVLDRSREIPVLVDFWAPWCGPCRMLGPVLESLAAEPNAPFELAKVNTDENPELAAHFQISGIPAVKLFAGGEVAAEFTGALPERAVRDFLRQHIPSEADGLVRRARELLSAGDPEQARPHLERALEAEPGHAGAHLELARLAVRAGDTEEAERHIAAIPASADEAETGRHLRELIELGAACRDAGGESACRDRLSADPDDPEARYALAACDAVAGRYDAALEGLLAVVAARGPRRDEAHHALLTLFGLLGRTPAVDQARRKLSIYL